MISIPGNYFENCRVIALDIETTGLDSNNNSIILVGILDLYGDNHFRQFFCENLSMEKDLLEFIIENVENSDVIITYNGASFDIPFINKRFIKFGIDYAIPAHKNLDLYKILRSTYIKSLLPNMKQKTMEAFIGIIDTRKDKISGYESVLKYLEFLKTDSALLKDEILLHNKDDILQLTQLLSLLKKIDIHKSMFKSGFPIVQKTGKIYLESIKIKANTLLIKAHYYGFLKEAMHYSNGYNLIFSKQNNTMIIEIPLYISSGHSFIDIREFDYSEEKISELMKYPGYVHGYLVVSENGVIRHNEINQFIKMICKDILTKI